MPKIKIPNPSEVFNEVYIPFITGEVKDKVIVLEGGRGSGKSRAISQALVLWSLQKKRRILLVRKVYETIRDSVYQEIRDVVEAWNLQHLFHFRGSPLHISNLVGSRFLCRGLDKSTKIKSIANIDILWIEEATELTEEDYLNLSLSIRGEDKENITIISFNRERDNWTERYFFDADGNPRNDHYHLYTTYHNNKFLDSFFVQKLEALKDYDFDVYQRHALGLPVRMKDIIFDNWTIVDEIPQAAKLIAYGIDFGYAEPTAVVACYKYDDKLYLDECIYQTHLTTEELCRKLDDIIQGKTEIIADSAEPDRIQEIYNYSRKNGRFNIYPVKKGKNSVIGSIDILKRYDIFVTRRSYKLIKEMNHYKFKRDKEGNILDEPVDVFNHAIDAMRYIALEKLSTSNNEVRILFEA